MEMGTNLRPARRALVAVLLLTGLALATASPTSATKPDSSGTHKVTICHRTNSDSNPYTVITVDYSAANGSLGNGNNDHTGHTGPPWSPGLKASHTKWGDIIPPYTYSAGTFPGMNWDAQGQAIYAAGCGIPQQEPPCPYNPAIPESSPDCQPPCEWDPSLPAGDPGCFEPCPHDPTLPVDDPGCVPPCVFDPSIPSNDPACPPPCPTDPSIPVTSPDCNNDG
jgi:hypothetical protein